MERRREFNLNIGLPSIMLIFVVLCLISFGILSLVSANADKRLSQKVLERSTAYYNACNQAEETISRFDARLIEARNSGASEQRELITAITGLSDIDSYFEIYTYYISDIQYLLVKLSINYTDSPEENLYKIDEWRVVTDTDLEYDDNLHIQDIQ